MVLMVLKLINHQTKLTFLIQAFVIQASNLLSPSCGEFKAPVAGTYQVSASAIVDTWEEGPQHAIFRSVGLFPYFQSLCLYVGLCMGHARRNTRP